ncbi:PIN domain-containing protein [Methanobrevibacter sp. TMH8]|uniref:type II toxin-antitoxin system VapC family toxin n=1 Tax=Methanobrevibacter sp. TMH8 TaxID=2848611 RepID=UPI001CC9A148|nr:PIN domain-containing protein [Methanobrevibacter sp. TMH8]MBZ9571234.1 PIN domain-containing protein [Methanobrevibacter sp. TMH8]
MIFLDTSFIVSYYVTSEKHHQKALKISKDIVGKEQIISRLIISEVVNVLHNKLKLDKEKIMELYYILNKNYTIIEDHHFYNQAMKMIMNYEKRLPFFDFIFMCVMEELEIKEIASFDEHFDLNKNINRIY